MNFAQQLATDLSNVVAGGKPQRAKAKPAKADDTIKLGKRPWAHWQRPRQARQGCQQARQGRASSQGSTHSQRNALRAG